MKLTKYEVTFHNNLVSLALSDCVGDVVEVSSDDIGDGGVAESEPVANLKVRLAALRTMSERLESVFAEGNEEPLTDEDKRYELAYQSGCHDPEIIAESTCLKDDRTMNTRLVPPVEFVREIFKWVTLAEGTVAEIVASDASAEGTVTKALSAFTGGERVRMQELAVEVAYAWHGHRPGTTKRGNLSEAVEWWPPPPVKK